MNIKFAEALSTGFKFDNTLLVEDYIPGRELRVAVVERNGELCVLPMIEYIFTPDNPIRTLQDKLEIQSDGLPESQPKNPSSQMVCPAIVTPELFEKLADAAKRAHLALGCRDYSLYDFRVHAETVEPYLLEAGLFWSFNKISMISRMLLADGQRLEDVALEIWQAAAGRTRVACGSMFKYHN
jgi:D-alanine-D-alanine ligase